jgi:hypothetical protein
VLQTECGTSRHGSDGDLTSNRNNLPLPSRRKDAEHVGLAHFDSITVLLLTTARSPISAPWVDISNSLFVLLTKISVTCAEGAEKK